MTTQRKVIKNKRGLLQLAPELGNVFRACKIVGYSLDSFYRFLTPLGTGGERAAQEISHQKPCLKNSLVIGLDDRVCRMALEKQIWKQLRVASKHKTQGVFVSPSGLRCMWQRHNLETFRKLLKALEAKAVRPL